MLAGLLSNLCLENFPPNYEHFIVGRPTCVPVLVDDENLSPQLDSHLIEKPRQIQQFCGAGWTQQPASIEWPTLSRLGFSIKWKINGQNTH